MTRNLLSPNAAFSSLFMRSKADFPKSEDSASWMRNLKLPNVNGSATNACHGSVMDIRWLRLSNPGRPGPARPACWHERFAFGLSPIPLRSSGPGRSKWLSSHVAHLHSKWSIYMDHLRPSLCYNRVIIFALGSWNLQLNSTFLK